MTDKQTHVKSTHRKVIIAPVTTTVRTNSLVLPPRRVPNKMIIEIKSV
jgi:hypothetical protein